MSIPRHPPEKRQAALAALRASIGRSGQPRWAAVARETGVDAKTLRRWWKAAEEGKPAAPVLELYPGGADDPAPLDLEVSEHEFLGQLLRDVHRLSQTGGDIAAMQAMKMLPGLWREYQTSRPREAGPEDLSEEGYLAQLADQAGEMPLAYLEVFVREYLTRNPRARLTLVG